MEQSNIQEAETEQNTDGKKSRLREVMDFVVYVLVICLLSFLIIHFVAQRTEVVGDSMNDTLQSGDSLLVDKISYRFGDIHRFDIVVFHPRVDENTYYIKRIIGLPGETIQINDEGTIFIDGEVLEESYGKEVILNPGRALEPITLGEDEYFVLGDNRNGSEDSRYEDVGNVTRSSIAGRAFLRLYPFNKFGGI